MSNSHFCNTLKSRAMGQQFVLLPSTQRNLGTLNQKTGTLTSYQFTHSSMVARGTISLTSTLRRKYGVIPITNKMRKWRLHWFGHVSCQLTEITKTAFDLTIPGKKRRETHWMRCIKIKTCANILKSLYSICQPCVAGARNGKKEIIFTNLFCCSCYKSCLLFGRIRMSSIKKYQ